MAHESKPKNVPAFGLRNGALQVAVWSNPVEGENRPFETVTLSRAYFDQDAQEWKYSNRFKLDELPRLILLLQDAYAQRRHEVAGQPNESETSEEDAPFPDED